VCSICAENIHIHLAFEALSVHLLFHPGVDSLADLADNKWNCKRERQKLVHKDGWYINKLIKRLLVA
jgi:hypothetical protein